MFRPNTTEYWSEHYTMNNGDSELRMVSSSFSRWCIKQHLQLKFGLGEYSTLGDVGCGNGVDTMYLSYILGGNGSRFFGIDICPETSRHWRKIRNASHIVKDALVSTLPYDVVYARFLLHALTEEEQKDFLMNCHDDGVKCLCLETRSNHDPVSREKTPTHFRRLQSMKYLLDDLRICGWRPIRAVEDWNDAHYFDDKAVVLRVIALRNEP